MLNSLIFVILIFQNSDFTLWFFTYEVSVMTAVSAILLESRSYRRFYAFVLMLVLTTVSSIAIYGVLNFSHLGFRSWVFVVLLVLVVSTKIPLVPFSSWLPEAHVEASWSGSVLLASYALKFCVIAILQFLFLEIQNLDSILLLSWTSFVFASLAMVSVIDTKKLIANFSIVHVAAALIGTLSATNSEFVSSFSWHHHSIITGLIFWQIGLVYATSGSRLLRWIFPTATISLNLVIWFFLMTLSSDLPWTSNILIEISLLKSFHDPWIFVSLLFSFWSIFSLSAQSWTSKSQKLVSNSDLEVTNSSGIIFSATAIIGLGFAKSSPYSPQKTKILSFDSPKVTVATSDKVRDSAWRRTHGALTSRYGKISIAVFDGNVRKIFHIFESRPTCLTLPRNCRTSLRSCTRENGVWSSRIWKLRTRNSIHHGLEKLVQNSEFDPKDPSQEPVRFYRFETFRVLRESETFRRTARPLRTLERPLLDFQSDHRNLHQNR